MTGSKTDSRRQSTAFQFMTGGSPATQPQGDISHLGISVGECLRIAPMREAVVVGGHGGLDRLMSWVHVVDHRDMEDSLDTNELLLTSGIALANDEALQREIFAIMDRRQSAGLVISIGEYISEIPSRMKEFADLFEIPLIAIPWDVNFGDITRVLLTQFVGTHYALMERSQRLHQELLGIVLREGDLNAVCTSIRTFAGVDAAIFDEQLRPIASSETGVDNPSRFSKSNLQKALSKIGFGQNGPSTVYITSLDGQVTGVAATIRVADRRKGFIAVELGSTSVGIAAHIVEIAANIAALLMGQEDRLMRVARRTESQLFGVLDGALPTSASVMAELGLNRSDPVTVVITNIDESDMALALDAAKALLRKHARQFALAVRGRSIVGLVQLSANASSAWSTKLVRKLRDEGFGVLLGVSGQISAHGEIPMKYDELRELMRVSHFFQPNDDVVNSEHATVLMLALRNLTSGSDMRAVCPAILKIEEHDRSMHGSLIEALVCFYEVDGNASLAARKLGVHRHTIVYRLNRISEILGTDLKGLMAFELRLQLLAWRLASE